jgi:AcrR family transcriptional regulator
MSERTNRRDLIIQNATNLFIEQGYTATSIRQIADAAGVTEAAIYYHFKDGKRELLQEVVECEMPDLMAAIDQCEDAASLEETIVKLLTYLAQTGRERMNRMRWFMAEFPNLSAEERAMFHSRHLQFQAAFPPEQFITWLTHLVTAAVKVEAIPNK